jgi:hypothetical protein
VGRLRGDHGSWHGRYVRSERTHYPCDCRTAHLRSTIADLLHVTKIKYTSPLLTAEIFLAFVIAVDFFVVALLMLKSLEMFSSPLGTWISFALIFCATYLLGVNARKRA